ncbi:hypothetical protein GCM10023190_08720 [Enteractinococcus fodinae]|uniref:Alkylation response protein AidB-like acyl-CoA dehydrogenase n=1 Tax=Enteractinococcus fodinae TaxID=684663 RepID=A0ABU2B052_9MICC|nr:acyl-CoA dehydrogenase family protein [Enteractinococcus fodinae]MDR7346651.1 alkylation response protein AidB-like acyl-CoA dehydrogenase [Enteractinococcus fodinae]
MTSPQAQQRLTNVTISDTLLSAVASNAAAIDLGQQTTRQYLSDLAAAGLADLGADPDHGSLLEQAAVIERLAEKSLSTAFSLWCHRMCIAYLRDAKEGYAHKLQTKLRSGKLIGSSAMASGFQYAAGLGDLSLRVHRDTSGTLRLTGHLGWAFFAPAYGPSESLDPVVVAFPVCADGVEVGPELDLLALRGTASTSVAVTDVVLPEEQILTTDLTAFLGRARPVLSVLQASFCVGLASESYRHLRTQLTGVKQTFTAEFEHVANRLAQVKHQLVELLSMLDTGQPPAIQRLIAARLEAGVVATELTRLETITAGSRGFVTTSAVNRRSREATFIPLQAPTEAQLRTELASLRAPDQPR